MPRIAALLWWIAVSASAVEPAAAQGSSVRIISSPSDRRVTFEVDPRPVGEFEVRVSVVDPTGNRRDLPPTRTKIDPVTGVAEGPVLPGDFAGFYFDIEVRDVATGRSLGGSGGFVN